MTPEQVAYALPIAITAIGFCFTTLVTGGTAFFVWYKERQAGRDKEVVISSAYTREQKRSNQIFDEASEKTALSQVLSSFSDLVKHSIEASNGQVGKLTTITIDGFSNVIRVVGENNAVAVTGLFDGLKEIAIKQAQQAAAMNQLNYYMQEQAIRNGGDVNTLKAALLRSEAVKRSEDIREAVDVNIKAEKDAAHLVESDSAHPADTPKAQPAPPEIAGMPPNVVAVLRAEPGLEEGGEK